MSLTSFLTQDPMTYTPTSGQTSTQLPAWYNDYTQGILSNAAQWANQGYQPYQGPQVAGLTGDQQSSYNTVAGQQGVGSGIAAAGAGQISSALQGPNASQAASPYLQAAAAPTSSQIGQYMNPYQNDVIRNANTIANQSFNEQVMPGLQNQFTQAGQVYGGTNQGVFANQLGRNLYQSEQMADQNSAAQGFNTALSGAQTQAGIYGNLAGTAGNAANAAQQTGIGGGTALAGAGTTEQQNALAQATAQNAMGTQQQQQTQNNYNTAYQDFLNQTNYPLTAAQGMGSALSGVNVPTGSSYYQYAPYGYGQSPLASGLATYGGVASATSALGGNHARGGSISRPQLRLRKTVPSAYQQWQASGKLT